MAKNNAYAHRINPRVRAFGKARIDIARRARTRQDWDSLWKRPQHSFPFHWGAHWKQCVEYRVQDFAAEVGFYIDILGLPVNAFNEYFAMFTGPQQEFYFAVTPTFEDQEPTPPDALRLQFLVDDIFSVADELVQRGIEFEQPPQPVAEGSSYFVGYFRTPHGIPIDLCGMVNLDELEIVRAEETEEAQVEAESKGEPEPGFTLASPRHYQPPAPESEEPFVEVNPAAAVRPGPGRLSTPNAAQPSIFSQPQPGARSPSASPERQAGAARPFHTAPPPASEPIYEDIQPDEEE
jgi:catechol 2,3-dioxygenase-like lactoylglutathione lyase family enzyme